MPEEKELHGIFEGTDLSEKKTGFEQLAETITNGFEFIANKLVEQEERIRELEVKVYGKN